MTLTLVSSVHQSSAIEESIQWAHSLREARLPYKSGGNCARVEWSRVSWLRNIAGGTTGLRAGVGTEGECGATQPYEVRRDGDGGFGVVGRRTVELGRTPDFRGLGGICVLGTQGLRLTGLGRGLHTSTVTSAVERRAI